MINLIRNATLSTKGVVLWVAVSAALTAVFSWMLDKPEYAAYYGVINVVLYFVKELNNEYKSEK